MNEQNDPTSAATVRTCPWPPSPQQANHRWVDPAA